MRQHLLVWKVCAAMKIEMSGYAYVRADAKTVKDLRTLLQFLNDNKVRDDAEIDWNSSMGYLYVVAADQAAASFIECGDHMHDLHFDVILNTHDHEPHVDSIAMFDWPAHDRSKYNDPSMPG